MIAKPTDSALIAARRLKPHIREVIRDAFERTPPTDPIWMERGYWPDITPVQLDAALKMLAGPIPQTEKRGLGKYSAAG